MRPILGALLLVLPLATTPARAQTAEEEVRAVVRQALDGLAQRDTLTLLAVFDSTAKLVLISYEDDQTSLAYVPIRAIIRSLANPGPRRREQLRHERISIASDLATLVADYVFYFDDVLHHCGTAMYDLARVQGRWRIVQIRQTDRRNGCTP